MITKPERHENEVLVFNSRHEAGLHAVHAWLCARREEINTRWLGLSGDDLVRLQGEAGSIAKLIRLIEHGPTIKHIEGKQND